MICLTPKPSRKLVLDRFKLFILGRTTVFPIKKLLTGKSKQKKEKTQTTHFEIFGINP